MYRVEITHTQDYSFKVKAKDEEFTVDIKGKGITPPDTFLAGLGTCIGVYIRKYAEGAKFNLSDFSIVVDAEFSPEPPTRFKNINVSLDLKGAPLDSRRQAGLLEFVKNCPIHNTLKGNPQINLKIV